MTGRAITIAGVNVLAGERRLIELPVASLYTHTRMNLPVHVINGRQDGPRVFVCAAVHGDELNGVEIIRRLLKQKSLSRLHGCLIVVPFVNPFGMIAHSRYLPDRRDLNRSFPGSERGPLASRLAHLFFDSIVRLCDYGIDLHTGALHRSNLPQVRANLADAQTRRLAEAFGVPVLINGDTRDGSLREAASAHGVRILLYEAGEALRLDEIAIRAGLRGILRVLRKLEMLPGAGPGKPASEPYIARSSSWVRAPHSGILKTRRQLGEHVRKDELLASVFDPSDLFEQTEHPIRAGYAGVIIGRTNIPLVNEGDAVFHIARFEAPEEVAAELDAFAQGFAPDSAF